MKNEMGWEKWRVGLKKYGVGWKREVYTGGMFGVSEFE